MIRLVIHGEIVPYVRVGRERWTPRAKRYFASQDAIATQAAAQMSWNSPATVPLHPQTPFVMQVTFYRHKLWTCDTDNLFKAIADALQGICYPDDRWMADIVASKRRIDRWLDYTEVEIEEIK